MSQKSPTRARDKVALPVRQFERLAIDHITVEFFGLSCSCETTAQVAAPTPGIETG